MNPSSEPTDGSPETDNVRRDTVSVRLADGRTVPAPAVAADTTHDLALARAAQAA
ncbi:hypothetical protein AB0J80_26725 [Actinoplanes sp. NPDC049548]|uniref:hypothetical protein n=1 Tax=Actinoplanes sp. NPDC049548 TaxID=3155152 RepID=UPI00341ACA08